MAKNDVIKFTNESKRRYDDPADGGTGHLHVSECCITSECVSDYLGKELQGYADIGLEPEKIYSLYRPLSELKKAVSTFDGKPLLDKHIAITAKKPEQKFWIGAIGTSGKIVGKDLLNDLSVWKQDAIDAILKADQSPNEGKKDLSCGYAYDLVPEEGVFEGKSYQFKMVNIRGNHVALVEDGRVESAMVADNNFKKDGKVSNKKPISSLLWSLFANDKKANDKAACDEANMKALSAIKKISGLDADEFEGGEVGKAREIIALAEKIEAKEKAEDAECEDEESKEAKEAEKEDKKDLKQKDKKAKDSEESEKDEDEKKDKKAEDEESDEDKEKDKKDAMDAAIAKGIAEHMTLRNLVIADCQAALGRISSKLLTDSTNEELIAKTLELKGVPASAYKSKSIDQQLAMVQAIGSISKAAPAKSGAFASDSKGSEYKKPNIKGL